ncbi:hypothetical protein [Microvirga rosea]|uniref:hypothetical protein n=1 Tax=Microvirga rosea TaxID=2715425 RepID=UPI001D0A74F6|nr:hypothetical protein [Microvirga rosea]MCB8823259.1 hypothetical protein [Microvirga rosea]
MKRILKSLSGAVVVALMAPSPALADGVTLAATLWDCVRARDNSRFLIMFYPDGGVGGGEVDKGVVTPYAFDASKTSQNQWPGRWSQSGETFQWDFPDQHMRIEGRIATLPNGKARLTGTETSLDLTSSVVCGPQQKAPKLGAGLVVPKDGHFLDPDDSEGELKVPTAASLQRPGRSR